MTGLGTEHQRAGSKLCKACQVACDDDHCWICGRFTQIWQGKWFTNPMYWSPIMPYPNHKKIPKGVKVHDSVMQFIYDQVNRFDLNKGRVLEVGSYDMNGTVRHLFNEADSYIGCDMRSGPGVDVLQDACNLTFAEESFDTVVSTEMLEHCRRPWEAMFHMGRVLKRGGTLLVTARGYNETGCFPVHDFPQDYWRYSTHAMHELCEHAGLTMDSVRDDPMCPGVFLKADKP